MDLDDPIQQLLQNTGWSCEDLLNRLQKYKVQKESQTQESVLEDRTDKNNSITQNQDLKIGFRVELDKDSNTHNSRKDYGTSDQIELSDTDVAEINRVSYSNTIDTIEIIDDALSIDNVQELRDVGKSTTHHIEEKRGEITNVQDIDEDCEDDYFVDECSSILLSTGDGSKNVGYSKVSPRPKFSQLNIFDLTDEDTDVAIEENTNLEETNPLGIEYIETYSRNNFVLQLNDDNEVNCVNMGDIIKDTSSKLNQSEEETMDDIEKTYSLTNDTDIVTSDVEMNGIPNHDEARNEQMDNTTIEEEYLSTNLEDLRNNLKLQLNCLRTRKKGHFLQQQISVTEDAELLSYNRRNEVSQYDNSTSTNKQEDEVNIFKTSHKNNEDALYTQTNELGIVISNVEGGVDDHVENNVTIVEDNRKDSDVIVMENSNTMTSALDNSGNSNSFGSQSNLENDEQLNEAIGVFEEIRKIIQKQKHGNSTSEKKLDSSFVSKQKHISNFNFFSTHTDVGCSKIDEKCDITSTDNSQSSFTNEETKPNFDKNSPFVSNTLDEFLTENSKLNISYKVPKCDAEEGIRENYREKSPCILKKIIPVDNDRVEALKTTVKPKTLAQKRKLLEKYRMKELKKKIKTGNMKLVETKGNSKQENASYVEVNNTRLWIKTTKPNVCVVKIGSSPEGQPKRKLSLLTDLGKKCNDKVKYLPGPLSKKTKLQINAHKIWETQTKLLPKITVEVIPKIGECLPPNVIARLPPSDGVVTANIAEFALSMLKTNNDADTEKNIFVFPVSYKNNQEKIIVKKQKVTPSEYSAEKDNESQSIESVVENVIDKLIRYVEIKEIAPTLIKDDHTENESNDSQLNEIPKIAENISNIIKKPHKKKSKVELELLRLNCKVVNVEVEENGTDETCNKSYCKLGCICKSLKCDGVISYHCQKMECMLECKCRREKSAEYDKLLLPAGTNILSRDAVTRIEDEAKKNLAKVEKEFTQTVIHTNDTTIVVGTGGRNKSRRCTKAPTKYSDFIDSDFEKIVEGNKTKMQEKNKFTTECYVSLQRLNLQEVIPYCMAHNMYDCHCHGNCLYSEIEIPKPTNWNPLSKSIIQENNDNRMIRKTNRTDSQSQSGDSEMASISDVQNSEETKIVTSSGRVVRINKLLTNNKQKQHNVLTTESKNCARTLGISSHTLRNRKRSASTLNKLVLNDFIHKITNSDIKKAKLTSLPPDALGVDILKRELILQTEFHWKSTFSLINSTLNAMNHKRKQTFAVRNDDQVQTSINLHNARNDSKFPFNNDLAIQRRKKSGAVTKKHITIVEPVFDGEIIIDKRNMDLLRKMGSRTVMDGYARLLPWKFLINSFNNGDIKIWCMIDQPSRLLINKSDKLPPKNYIDIKGTSQTTEIILWILRKQLPSQYHEDHVSFILKQTKDNYEICGLCTKNLNGTNSVADQSEELGKSDPAKDNTLFRHKDLNSMPQIMYISKEKFKLQELVEENQATVGETSIDKSNLYMWVALPEVNSMCKWRMIFLNSDFTFLYFTKVKYSIKYTDLLNIGIKAKNSNCTICLKNSVISPPYGHSSFGIYFDAHYQDRLFIGPYFKQHYDEDVETLRYINKSLVCTESFNKMQGRMDYKCGHWLIERPYDAPKEHESDIDLTNKTIIRKRKSAIDIDHLPVKKYIFSPKEKEEVQKKLQIQIIDGKARAPEEFNRYIITNIPHLGYLGAFQHESSAEIDVSWPFENKMLRFINVTSATQFLQTRFTSLLQPIPETFTIHIVVLTDLDLEKNKPIDVSILSGHYICGEFGCVNVKTVTDDFCVNKIGTNKESLLKIFARRAQAFIRLKIEELAKTINIPKTDTDKYNIENILNMAEKEIQSLINMEHQYAAKKRGLILKKRKLTLKAVSFISLLPDNEKGAENWKLKQILSKQSILLPQTIAEPIEISDSDEEEQKNVERKSLTVSEPGCQFSSTVVPSTNCKESLQMTKFTALPQTVPIKNNTTPMCTYTPQGKYRSVLKTNAILPVVQKKETAVPYHEQSTSKISSLPEMQYVSGIKLVQSSEGKLRIVNDNEPLIPKPLMVRSSLGGKQLVIKNSRILSVKQIDLKNEKNKNLQSIATPNLSPPKTIIIKRDSLLKVAREAVVTSGVPSESNSKIVKIGVKNTIPTQNLNNVNETVSNENIYICNNEVQITRTEKNTENSSNTSTTNADNVVTNTEEALLSKDSFSNIANNEEECMEITQVNSDERRTKKESEPTEQGRVEKPPDIEDSSNIKDIHQKPTGGSTETEQHCKVVSEECVTSLNASENIACVTSLNASEDLVSNVHRDVLDDKKDNVLSCQSEKNFLVDTVSEIIPTEAQVNSIDLTNAAALTQLDCAANNDTLNYVVGDSLCATNGASTIDGDIEQILLVREVLETMLDNICSVCTVNEIVPSTSDTVIESITTENEAHWFNGNKLESLSSNILSQLCKLTGSKKYRFFGTNLENVDGVTSKTNLESSLSDNNKLTVKLTDNCNDSESLMQAPRYFDKNLSSEQDKNTKSSEKQSEEINNGKALKIISEKNCISPKQILSNTVENSETVLQPKKIKRTIRTKPSRINKGIKKTRVKQRKNSKNKRRTNGATELQEKCVFNNESNTRSVPTVSETEMSNSVSITDIPLSKKITNVTVHTLLPSANTVSVEETELVSVMENKEHFNTILADQDRSDSNNVSVPDQNSTGTVSTTNVNGNKTSKRIIRCVSAKADTAFTIDTKSFPRKSRKGIVTKQPSTSEQKKVVPFNLNTPLFKKQDKIYNRQVRLRKESISTTALICASKIVSTENDEVKCIAKQIYDIAEDSLKEEPMKIDRQNFLKNVALAEKCINIENMKKKLCANISEDNVNREPKGLKY